MRYRGVFIALALSYLTFVLFHAARSAMNQENVDPSHVVALFGSVILVGLATGVVFAVSVLPAIGDAVGNYFFNPTIVAEDHQHSKAVAAVARGDFEAAIEAYHEVLREDPTDTIALSEMAKIYAEKLDLPSRGIFILEDALRQRWSPEQHAFLATRLADILWKCEHDAVKARAVLVEIAELMPGSSQAADAQRRLIEIQRQLDAG